MTPKPGSVWREKRPDAITRDLDNQWRRLVEVQAAEEHGFVEGIGRWQIFEDGRWQDSPATSRRTRVRTRLFVQRYEEIQP